MSTESVNYTAILADLEAKKKAIEAAITSLRSALSVGALGLTLTDGSVMQDAVAFSLGTGEVPDGAFLGKSIPEAAKLYLEIVKKKQTTREIAEALVKGGMESTSKKNWLPIVHAALVRARKSGAIVKVGTQWGLTGWYPKGILSGTVVVSVPGGKKKQGKAKGGQKKASPEAKTAAGVKPAANPVPIMEKKKGATSARLIQVLNSKPGEEFAPRQVAEQLGLDAKVTHMLLARLVKSNKAEQTASGNYRVATVMPQMHAVI